MPSPVTGVTPDAPMFRPLRRVVVTALTGVLLVAPTSAIAQASALARLNSFNFTFTMTPGVCADRFKPSGTERISLGRGSNGSPDERGNFLVACGPSPAPYEYSVFNGPVQAFAPPPDMSYYQTTHASFVDFANLTPGAVNITMSWDANALLSAVGAVSAATLAVYANAYQGVDGGPLGAPLWTESVVNDRTMAYSPSGSLAITLPPGMITTFRVTTVGIAQASVVPEPGTLFFVCVGAVGTFLVSAARVQRPGRDRA